MIFHIVSIFPDSFKSYFSSSIMKNARAKWLFDYKIYNICDYSVKNTRRVDDRPYWWFPWTIISIEPLYKAISDIISTYWKMDIIYLWPRGKKYTQLKAEKFAKKAKDLILICGHYEGIDERIIEMLNVETLSLWDYILTSWELASMVFMDSIVRLLPWSINKKSLIEESFSKWLWRKKEYPQYSRPEDFKWYKAPTELLSWNPKIINIWKNKNIK